MSYSFCCSKTGEPPEKSRAVHGRNRACGLTSKKCLHCVGACVILRAILFRGYSSVGRAFEWHSKGQEFDSPYLHHKEGTEDGKRRARLAFFVVFGGTEMLDRGVADGVSYKWLRVRFGGIGKEQGGLVTVDLITASRSQAEQGGASHDEDLSHTDYNPELKSIPGAQ